MALVMPFEDKNWNYYNTDAEKRDVGKFQNAKGYRKTNNLSNSLVWLLYVLMVWESFDVGKDVQAH